MKNSVLLTMLLAIAASLGINLQAASDPLARKQSTMTGFRLGKDVPNRLGAHWTPLAQADFDRDGNLDILFQDPAGILQVQLMERNFVQVAVMVREEHAPAKGWKLIAAADFNNDKFADILFQHPDGRLAVWWLRGASFVSSEEIAVASAEFQGVTGQL